MRSTLSVGVALLGSLVLSAPASAASETARTTNEFVDTVGINIHSSYNNTPYDQHDQVLASLRELGIRHVRDNFMPPTESAARQTRQRAFRRALADHGIRSTVQLGKPGEDPAAYVASARLDDPGVLAAIEGPNEFDLTKRPNWVAEVRDYQARLHAVAKADTKLRDLPLLGPSVGNPSNAAAFGDVSAWSDRANIHAYPGGKAPGTFTDVVGSQTAMMFGGKSPIVTETGYHNAASVWGGHPYVPEDVAATYLPKLFLDNFRRGIERTFSYELINAYHDPNQWVADAHFGLLRQDFSMKPVGERMRNLMRLIDPDATAGARGALDYTLQGDLTGVERVLLRRADGTFVLALWQKGRVYDEYARRHVSVSPRSLTVRTAAPVSAAAGRAGASPTAAPVSASTTSVPVTIPGDDVVVLHLRPTGAAPVVPVTPPPAGGGDTTPEPAPVVPAPAPTPAPTPAPQPQPLSWQEQWRRALANLKRALGLRTAGQPASKAKAAPRRAKAKKQASSAKKRAAKKRAAKKR